MKIALIGADLEENLGVGIIGAVAANAGHHVRVIPFDHLGQVERVVDATLAEAPDVVGLSMQFQHRAHEFMRLARRLRERGYAGHVTCGGQFPTLAWQDTLRPAHGIDTVVLYDGEVTFRELLAALDRGADLSAVAGLALRGPDGAPARTAGRRLDDDLDTCPFPLRYRGHNRHHGVPFVPVMASRGCWGRCTYCSIISFYNEARAHGGGKTVRMRSPRNVAEELAVLWHRAGGEAIFCFHDDNFLLPRPEHSLARAREIRRHLDALGVGRAAIIGKCRPETVTHELARELRALGVIRLYVGVENAAEQGSDHLGRDKQHESIDAALNACREAGIFNCYNLLIFEPDATLDDVRTNVRFIRDHAAHPVNFCRAEPYHGTLMHHELARRGNLGGSYLGYDYQIHDPRVELLFRICAAAFRQRNFDPEGVANRYMGVGYTARVVEFFYGDGPAHRLAWLLRRADELTRDISLDTAGFLDEAIALAEAVDLDDLDRIERETALLGLRVAAADKVWHAQLDEYQANLASFVRDARRPRAKPVMSRRVTELARRVMVGVSLAAWTTSCSSTTTGTDAAADSAPDMFVVDPTPPDVPRVDAMDVTDAADVMDAGMDRPDIFVVDPPPPDVPRTDAAMDDGGTGFDASDVTDSGPDRPDMFVVDPPPPDVSRLDMLDALDSLPGGATEMMLDEGARPEDQAPRRRLELIDRWRETSPRRATRSRALALSAPPEVSLAARDDDGAVRVEIVGLKSLAGTRWEGDGVIEGDGPAVRWRPEGGDDQIRVAMRTQSGVAVLALRARDVKNEARARSLA